MCIIISVSIILINKHKRCRACIRQACYAWLQYASGGFGCVSQMTHELLEFIRMIKTSLSLFRTCDVILATLSRLEACCMCQKLPTTASFFRVVLSPVIALLFVS
ncbi:unnamed protein product [Ixodes pacificus]